MAADATHNQSTGGNYHKQGGNDWYVGGNLEIGAGATFPIRSVIDASTSGAYMRNYVETGTTTADLTPYGTSLVTNSSAGGTNVYTIAAPIKGVPKHIACLQADSTDQVHVDMAGSASVLLGKTGQTLNKIVFATSGAANNQAAAITLMGVSTSQWVILGTFGTVGTTS